MFLAWIFSVSAKAQNYSIDFFSIDGGGGISTGGSYSLVGTIGQPDAGKLTGGNYTLDGGFLSGIVLVQATGAPLLSIQLSTTNAIISWQADISTGFVLEESTSLDANSWNPSGATVNTSGNTKSVTVSATGIRFYRLRKP